MSLQSLRVPIPGSYSDTHEQRQRKMSCPQKLAVRGTITAMVGKAVQVKIGAGWTDGKRTPRWERQSEEGGKESHFPGEYFLESPGRMERVRQVQPVVKPGRARTMIKQKMSTVKHRSTKVTAQGHWAQVEEAAKHNRDRGLD